LIGLTVAAAVTKTLRLGTGVCLIPEHPPVALAKRIASLDLYSNGRFMLGTGAGWQPEESAALGGDFPRR
jgi:alkanesulfonate monooxygenase SsuD/methylene tetrahydromethanopterin reductase-like flavin-dependent oxidoreductase (luciferase family)